MSDINKILEEIKNKALDPNHEESFIFTPKLLTTWEINELKCLGYIISESCYGCVISWEESSWVTIPLSELKDYMKHQ